MTVARTTSAAARRAPATRAWAGLPVVIALVTAIAGCRAPQPADPTLPLPTAAVDEPTPPLLATRPPAIDPPADARQSPRVFTRLDCYVLTVPFGTVSRSDELWKRVDEQALDPETYDVMFRNGVRVGRAPTAEWAFFRDAMARHPTVTQQGDLAGGDGKGIELAMRRDVDRQTIFYVDAANVLKGRTYDRCDDLISLTFHPAPRTPGAVRVAVVPLVRSQRVRIEYDAQNVGREIRYVSPERLYDLNLRAEIGPDQFLVIAPSVEARWPTSVGHTFLTAAGVAEQLEHVILLVPRSVRAEEVTTEAAQ